MSVWADIRRRGNGKEIKKEDEINIQEFVDPADAVATKPVTFVGCIDSEDDLRNVPRLCGKMYMVNDTIKIDGKEYHNGDMIIDDGQNWHVISHSDLYIGQ